MANKLGLSLQQTKTITDGLLDVESSLQNEFEAEVLTGKQINLDKAKEMLVEAVNISKGRGYILDSLGWAYFLLKDFEKAEEILQIAYEKEPSEAVIYDHYGDVLWTNGKEIQARYVWQNAVKLKNIEQDLKESINKKIIFGLDNVIKNES